MKTLNLEPPSFRRRGTDGYLRGYFAELRPNGC